MPSTVDCIDTFTVGTAILSFSVKSAMVFTFGLRVTRMSGTVPVAPTALTPALPPTPAYEFDQRLTW